MTIILSYFGQQLQIMFDKAIHFQPSIEPSCKGSSGPMIMMRSNQGKGDATSVNIVEPIETNMKAGSVIIRGIYLVVVGSNQEVPLLKR